MKHNWNIFSVFFNMKVCCVFSLELHHRGDSNEQIQYTIFNIKKKITLIYPNSAELYWFFQETQERVRNSRDKRAISVWATRLKNEFETAVINEPSVFGPLKDYCVISLFFLPPDFDLSYFC